MPYHQGLLNPNISQRGGLLPNRASGLLSGAADVDPRRQLLDKIKREHAESFGITSLPSNEEAEFQEFITNSDWHKEFVSDFGGPPNLNDPDYDYRGAWKEMGAEMFGVDPESGKIHGFDRAPSGKWLKSPQHPTVHKQYEMELQSEPKRQWGF
jgi:hypothetical protein